MSGSLTFFAALWRNLGELPASVRAGLRPGVAEGEPKRMRRSFVYHLHPARVTLRALRPSTTLGLGLISLTLALLLTLTGLLLMAYYEPTTKGAWASVQDLQSAVALGGFVRALHRWTAHALALTVPLHLLRVAAMGAYRRRELNWLFGLSLLAVTLGLAFTGYLLPWDQLSYWAVTVASSLLDHAPLLGAPLKTLLLGGASVGQATLTRFYALHVAVLPAAMVVLVALHLWRVRKDGGLATSADAGGEPPSVNAWPHLLVREAALMLGVAALACLAALLFQAPLGGPPDLHTPSSPEKAPWYFLWLQEMVSYSAPVGGFVFPGVLTAALVSLPFLEREDAGIGSWLGEPKTRSAVVAALAIGVVGFVGFEALSLKVLSGAGGDLLNPATGMLALCFAEALVTGARTGSTRTAALSGIAVLAVAVLGFTLLAVCRGPEWILYWPWEAWPHAS